MTARHLSCGKDHWNRCSVADLVTKYEWLNVEILNYNTHVRIE